MTTSILNHRSHKFTLRLIFAIFSFCLIVIFALKGRAPQPEASFAHMVFGIDDRLLFPLKEKPWLGIGRVEIEISDGKWSNCTGSLIARDLVLTGAHCLVVKGRERGTNILFRAGVQGTLKWSEARVVEKWVGTQWPDENRAEDWAVLRLDQPLGDATGWLRMSPSLIGERMPVTLAGYGDDFMDGHQVSVQSNCMLRHLNRRFGYFLHDCDMNSGTSGAPMVIFKGSTPYIIALNVAHTGQLPIVRSAIFSARSANVAIDLSKADALIKRLLARTSKEERDESTDPSLILSSHES